MFNTYIHQDYSKGMNAISTQMQMDRISRENIAEKEIKARDRVNISLDEYERMKEEISSLQWEVNQMRNKMELFKEVIDLNIIQDTFVDLYDYDPFEMKSKCIIKFEFIPEHGKRYVK
jgi:HAMP domain-containing protein